MFTHRFQLLSKRLVAWLLACGCISSSFLRSELPLWTNSLGIRFASVAVVSRDVPDALRARKILMATLETAEEQVAMFRRETGLQAAQHSASADSPAKFVSWTEAVAFCACGPCAGQPVPVAAITDAFPVLPVRTPEVRTGRSGACAGFGQASAASGIFVSKTETSRILR